MFPDYSTFKTDHRLSNCYDTLGYATRIPIEGISTTVCTLNGRTILTRNAIHIPAIQGPLHPLHKHHQIPGCGVYSYCKEGSYIFFPDFILQVEDYYVKIVRYRPLVISHQGTIDYIESRSTRSTAMSTPSSLPSMITPEPPTQSPQIIPSDEDLISSQPPLPPSIEIDCLPHP